MSSQPAPVTGSTSSSDLPVTSPLAAHPAQPISSTSTTTTATEGQDAEGRQSTAAAPRSSELAGWKMKLKAALRHFPDFPIKGIDFVDIMPLFLDPSVHETLVAALDLQIRELYSENAPDVIVGLDARGFLFGPGLALRRGVSFAPVRKKGKLPGPCVTAEYQKEYGVDLFQMQNDAIKPGQKVLIVDDIIATGGSAKAAADLVKQLGGEIMGFLFILEIPGLNGREKLESIQTTILLEDA
ncbi:adenine phosphoribosyltransferase [Sodiomyces alkalinus F11]|uniref:adenine phosphoribosyltransferase n=1 Tax=Sodiomyces alkalinus (strain CBS 110278 / VKM F-3762 / F11) TaxID=1314773 RepID=A0A3N2PZB6_SODAK|nr:adenine phosphoribosyltransferase [Sodiomyces alkalinus F11]ROT39695.1 adenine phosphoribosyltransferase [Sodiomyces alkalinus F11]